MVLKFKEEMEGKRKSIESLALQTLQAMSQDEKRNETFKM
jgi:hypothetical protein